MKKIRAVYLPCLSFNFSTVRPQDSLFFLSQQGQDFEILGR